MPEPDDMVWVRTATAGGRVDTYHTNEECKLLAHATSPRERVFASLLDDVELCPACAGKPYNRSEQDHGYQRALKAAAAEVNDD